MVKKTNMPVNNNNKTISGDINELDIDEMEAVTAGNAGVIDWLSDSLEHKITTVEKPKFQQ